MIFPRAAGVKIGGFKYKRNLADKNGENLTEEGDDGN